MACALTARVGDLKLSTPPSFHRGFSSSRTASNAEEETTNHHLPPPPLSAPGALTSSSSTSCHHQSSSHSAAADDAQGSDDANPDSPHSHTSPSLQPESSPSSSTNGNSCHQCKTAKDASLLLFCTSAAEKGVRKRRCRKKYCLSCLKRSYNPEVAAPSAAWVCPSCAGFCVCAACSRGGDGELSKEKISGGLATLSQMNPNLLALLGIDERKIAHLQAVVNSPTLSGLTDTSGLLAMLASITNQAGAGLSGMQDLSLVHGQHAHHQAAAGAASSFLPGMPQGGGGGGCGGDECGLGHAPPQPPFVIDGGHLRSAASTASTVSSPYASSASSYSSSAPSTSSPPLRAVMNGQPSPIQPLPPAASSLMSHTSPPATPTYSPRMVSRSHTHAPPHPVSVPAYPRLLSHSPPSSQSVHSSAPSPSRHLHDVEALEGSYQRQLAVSRKRSWSNSLGEEDEATAVSVRQRFMHQQQPYGGQAEDFLSQPVVKLEDPQLSWGLQPREPSLRAPHAQAAEELRRRLFEAREREGPAEVDLTYLPPAAHYEGHQQGFHYLHLQAPVLAPRASHLTYSL